MEFITYARHKVNHAAYGAVFKTETGIAFQKEKWTAVNNGKSPPKVCFESVFTTKEVDDSFWEHFERRTRDEYLEDHYVDITMTEKLSK